MSASRPRRLRRTSDHETPAERGAIETYLREIRAYPLLTRDEEAALGRRIRAGDQSAVDALVRSNLRFVVSIAARYERFGVPLADLVNEGNVGLLRAASRFDDRNQGRFVSYAVWWVRQAILDALTANRNIVRRPRKVASAMWRIAHRARRLEQEMGHAVTAAEVAERANVPEADVVGALAAVRADVPLDDPVRDGEDAVLERLADERAAPPDDAVTQTALTREIGTALTTLPLREARVLRLYFGFDGDPRTLDEIGTALGVTRERAREIKEKALRRLRRSPAAAVLDQYR